MLQRLLLTALLIITAFANAQQASLLGKVIDARLQEPIAGATATLQASGRTALTNADGFFVIDKTPDGEHLLTVQFVGYVPQTFSLNVIDGRTLDLGVILLEEDIRTEQQLGLITLTESDLADGGSGSETTAGLLQASRDAFQQAAAFNWGQARFRVRGLDSEYGQTLINGISMNRLYDGRPQWANWGGLNDATRHQEFTTGFSPVENTFGSLLGTQSINTRASTFRKGSRISFAGTNTFYNYRAMATHASGLNAKGFAYVVSASRRGAGEGYFDGTGFGGNSLFLSFERRFSDSHSLTLTAIYAGSSRERNSPNTQEVTIIC